MPDNILEGELAAPWSCVDNLILHGRRIHVLETSPTLVAILKYAHMTHEGVQKTLQCLRADFHVSGDRRLMIWCILISSVSATRL